MILGRRQQDTLRVCQDTFVQLDAHISRIFVRLCAAFQILPNVLCIDGIGVHDLKTKHPYGSFAGVYTGTWTGRSEKVALKSFSPYELVRADFPEGPLYYASVRLRSRLMTIFDPDESLDIVPRSCHPCCYP